MRNKLVDIKKIAILRANGLGDFIFSLPAIDSLKEVYPDTEIVLLGKRMHQELLKDRKSNIDRVIEVPISRGIREEIGKDEDPDELERFFDRMKDEQFDLAIQMHGGGKNSNPFVQKLGARFTLGLQDYDAPPLDQNLRYILYQNEVSRYLELVRIIGVNPVSLTPKVNISEKDLNEVESILGSFHKPIIVLHPGATDLRRRWPSEKFAEVGDHFYGKGFEIVVVGSGDEKEAVEKIIEKMSNPAINCYQRLSMSGLVGLLSLAELTIANDSGPLHLSQAVGTPAVGIYWFKNLINCVLLERGGLIVLPSWRRDCPLCGINLAPRDLPKSECDHLISLVEEIEVEDVIKSGEDLLKNSKFE